jgi:hypothetical protein
MEQRSSDDALLARLRDTLEIQQLKARYCRAADMVIADADKATGILRDLFTPDVVADYSVLVCNGREELLTYLVATIAANSDWLLHFLTSPSIEIDGDEATGDWALIVQVKQKHMPGKEMLVGRYSDRFVRTPDGWKIADIKFTEEGIYHLVPHEQLGKQG